MSESEFYKMPTFAMLGVADPAAAAEWYEEALGFRQIARVYETKGNPGFTHVRRDRYQDILLLDAVPGSGRALGMQAGFKLIFRTEEDLDELADRAYAAGALIVEGPVDKPWNAREVTVQDVDGYRITFSSLSWISGLF